MNDKEKLRKYVQKLIENAITPDLLAKPNPNNKQDAIPNEIQENKTEVPLNVKIIK